MMNDFAKELRKIAGDYSSLITNLPDAVSNITAGRWSRKEELGHLIDSAQNNIRRFIVSLYETNPHIIYDQNYWVKASGYDRWTMHDLNNLWFLLNMQLVEIWNNIDADESRRFCNTGKVGEELHSLHWLAGDYIKHQLHHLHHLLDLEPVGY